MKHEVMNKAEKIEKKKKRKKSWLKVVTCLAAVVVFVTVYALIIPAVAMEKDGTENSEGLEETYICALGLEEHEHGDDCYTSSTEGIDSTEEAESNEISDESKGELICEKKEHAHTDTCAVVYEMTAEPEVTDGPFTMKVTITSEKGFPAGTEVAVTAVGEGEEVYGTYLTYAEEEIGSESLSFIWAYQIAYSYDGEKLEISNANAKVEINVNSDTEKDVQYTFLQNKEGTVLSSEKIVVNDTGLVEGEEATTEMAVSIGTGNSYAIVRSAKSDPVAEIDEDVTETGDDNLTGIKFEYYANIEHFETVEFDVDQVESETTVTDTNEGAITPSSDIKSKDGETSLADTFWIINTDNPTDGRGGRLPENGVSSPGTLVSSPVKDNNLLFIKMGYSKDGTECFPTTQEYVTKVRTDESCSNESEYSKYEGLSIADMNKLNGNDHYNFIFFATQTVTQYNKTQGENVNLNVDLRSGDFDEKKYLKNDFLEYVGQDGKNDYCTYYSFNTTETTADQYILTVKPENKGRTYTQDEKTYYYIYLEDGMRVYMGYQATEQAEEEDTEYNAVFFDYDISDGQVWYFEEGTTYSNNTFGTMSFRSAKSISSLQNVTDKSTLTSPYDLANTKLLLTRWNGGALGINSYWNYGDLDSQNNLAFGNANTYTGLEENCYQDTEVTVSFNKESGVEDLYKWGTWVGKDGTGDGYTDTYYYSFLGCSFELAQSYNYTNRQLTFNSNIDAPDLFSLYDSNSSENGVTGKTTYADSSLGFTRDGDTYTLSWVSVDGNTLGDLQDFKIEGSDTATRVISNDFWPLDNFITDDTEGHDFKFTDTTSYEAGTMRSLQLDDTSNFDPTTAAYGAISSPVLLPKSDNDDAHNCYFGMTTTIDFEVDQYYIGPLEYLFYGDDDMWVFLTELDENGNAKTNDDGTENTQLIADIGGVHGSVGTYVDLWDWVEKGTGGKYALTIFYTERGASGSSCYMQFTLPNMSSEDLITEEDTGAVKILKEETGDKTDEEYEFNIVITEAGSTEESKKYTYTVYRSDASVKGTGYFNGSNTTNVIKLKANEYVIVDGLPIGTEVTVWETDGSYYDAAWTGEGGDKTDNGGYTGIIKETTDGKNLAVDMAWTCTNTLYGDLKLTKEVVDPKELVESGTEYKFKISVKNDEEYLTGEYSTVTTYEGTETTGSITFTDEGIKFKKAATDTETREYITLKDGESIVIQRLPAGYNWTITEIDTDGYNVTNENKTDGTTSNSSTVSGTIKYGSIAEGGVAVLFINSTGYVLPSTGGIGTIMYTFGGLVLIGVVIGLMYKKFRRKEDIAI